jgi:anti-sigma factor RsiW
MEQDIELQLWEYIDGTGDAATKAHVEHKIATDAEWEKLYKELSALNSLIAETEMEQPSMRFSKNVMEIIAQTTVAPIVKRYINPLIIRLIAGFFIVSMLILIAYSFSAAEISMSESSRFSGLLNSNLLTILSWISVVTGLVFIDALLRRRKYSTSRAH